MAEGIDAKSYWLDNLSHRAKATREKYEQFFDMFCEWLGKTPNEIFEERKADLKKEDEREQMRYENLLKKFAVYLQEERGYSISSSQVGWASVKSFFMINRKPLQTLCGDYPEAESLGYRAFTKQELRKLVSVKGMSLRSKVIIYCLKDAGLRVGDLAKLKYGDVQEGLQNGEKFVSVKLVTGKKKTVETTFFGEETVELLKKYMDRRRKGTRYVAPEVVTKDSPLIRKQAEFGFTSRSCLSSLVSMYVTKAGFNGELSAHSLRKYTQTMLESGGVHANWIDKMLGHALPNNGTYTRPSDGQLRDAYVKAYDALRIVPRSVTTDDLKEFEEENKRLKEEVARLKQRQDEINGLKDKVMQELRKELGIS